MPSAVSIGDAGVRARVSRAPRDEPALGVDQSSAGIAKQKVLDLLRWPASIAFCAVFPALVVASLFATAVHDDAVAMDFGIFYGAAESLLRQASPYVTAGDPTVVVNSLYIYPPLTAVGVIPFTLLPMEAAGLLAMAALTVALLAIPFTLGVRDWRCYGLALMWPPAISAIQTGSVTILLALGAALVWRFRERPSLCSLTMGVTVVSKLFLWPLLAWLVATRRAATAALCLGIGILLGFGSWAAIGFAGLTNYPDLLRWAQKAQELHCYTTYVVVLDAGASPSVARAIWLAVGLGGLAAVVLIGRKGDERTAFVLAIAVALALSPIVWLHYFTLLLVVVALAQPRLGVLWFVPLAMFMATGNGNPSPFQTATTLAAAAVTVGGSAYAIRRGLSSSVKQRVATNRLWKPSGSFVEHLPRA